MTLTYDSKITTLLRIDLCNTSSEKAAIHVTSATSSSTRIEGERFPSKFPREQEQRGPDGLVKIDAIVKTMALTLG